MCYHLSLIFCFATGWVKRPGLFPNCMVKENMQGSPTLSQTSLPLYQILTSTKLSTINLFKYVVTNLTLSKIFHFSQECYFLKYKKIHFCRFLVATVFLMLGGTYFRILLFFPLFLQTFRLFGDYVSWHNENSLNKKSYDSLKFYWTVIICQNLWQKAVAHFNIKLQCYSTKHSIKRETF